MQAKGLKRGEDFVDCEPPPLLLCPRKHGLLHVPPSGTLGGFKVSALAAFARLLRPCAVNVLWTSRSSPPSEVSPTTWSEHRRSCPPLLHVHDPPSAYGKYAKGLRKGPSRPMALPLLSLPPAHVWNAGEPPLLQRCCEISALGAPTTTHLLLTLASQRSSRETSRRRISRPAWVRWAV